MTFSTGAKPRRYDFQFPIKSDELTPCLIAGLLRNNERLRTYAGEITKPLTHDHASTIEVSTGSARRMETA